MGDTRGEVWVAQLRLDNQALPSLLGWNILQDYEIVVNWAGRRVSLESV